MASEEEAGAPEQERQEGGEGGVQGERPAEKKVNYYEVLGVDQDADEATIRKTYKKKALKLHPDKNRDDPDAQNKFALLNEALQVLTDPLKRMDHNKDLEGGVVGWGFDRKAAQERAKNYQWTHPGQMFSRGEAGEGGRKKRKYAYVWDAARTAAVIWGATVVLMAILEALLVATAVHIGMPQTAVVWGSLLGGFLVMGLVVWLKTDAWTFPAGGLCAVVCGVSLVVGLLGADCLVQAHAFNSRKVTDLDAGGMPMTHFGVYAWREGVVVDGGRGVRGEGGVCAAPIVRGEEKGGNYSLALVGYWAVANGCCQEAQEPTCAGWGKEWGQGLNWWLPERASPLFLKGGPEDSAETVFKTIASVNGGSGVVGPVAVEWSPPGELARRFQLPAWTVLFVVTLCWPVAFCLLWALLTLGFLFFKPKLHCHRPLHTWCCYVSSGCPGCWSELELIDE